METFSDFTFELYPNEDSGWYYKIYSLDGQTLVGTADESYDSEGIARYAAIGHIHLMEINNSESGRS